MARKLNINYTKDGSGKGVATVEEERKLIIPGRTGALVQADTDEIDEDQSFKGLPLLTRLAIIEGLSPQIKPRASEYIVGAKLGQFCDTTFKEVWDELYFVPLLLENIYIKWAPRETGEGLIAYYGTDPTEYNRCAPKPGEFKHFDEDGNEVVQHGTVFLINLSAGEQFSTFPMSSTRYKEYTTLKAIINKQTTPSANGPVVLKPCTYIYHAIVGEKSRGTNQWHLPKFELAKPSGSDQPIKLKEFDPSLRLWNIAVAAAKELKNMVRAGTGGVKESFVQEEEETSRENAAM